MSPETVQIVVIVVATAAGSSVVGTGGGVGSAYLLMQWWLKTRLEEHAAMKAAEVAGLKENISELRKELHATQADIHNINAPMIRAENKRTNEALARIEHKLDIAITDNVRHEQKIEVLEADVTRAHTKIENHMNNREAHGHG